MQDMSISYTGLDFDEICKNHASVLADQGITDLELSVTGSVSYLTTSRVVEKRSNVRCHLPRWTSHYVHRFCCMVCLRPPLAHGVIAFDDALEFREGEKFER